MNIQQTYVAYSDESGINDDDQYTSVAIVSGERRTVDNLKSELTEIVNNNRIKEVKFNKVTRYKSPMTQAARCFMNCAIGDYASGNRIRIDVQTKYNEPSLNTNVNGDYKIELERMYYNLFLHIGRCWQQNQWSFYPDINSQIKWAEIIAYLKRTRLRQKSTKSPLLIDLLLGENPSFEFTEVKQVGSVSEPLVQLADLFAGLARFTYEEKPRCAEWVVSQRNINQKEFPLCLENETDVIIRRTKRCRYQLIGELYRLCGRHRLHVSLRTRRYLSTWKPKYPINFWDYKPSK